MKSDPGITSEQTCKQRNTKKTQHAKHMVFLLPERLVAFRHLTHRLPDASASTEAGVVGGQAFQSCHMILANTCIYERNVFGIRGGGKRQKLVQ